MDFNQRIDEVARLHSELMQCEPLRRDRLPIEMKGPGVYLFSDAEVHYYVGRSREVRERVMQHSRASVLDAPFAFKRAREVTGNNPTYQVDGSRTQLLADDAFVQELLTQKRWIATLNIRYIHIEDAITQALLEIYSSDQLQTPYNDFNTT